jgi:16S rRNA processing protein RimM
VSDPPSLLEVGRIGRAHGLRGEVIVHLVTDRTERVAPGAVLHGPDGTFEVATSRPIKRGHVVQFVGVAGREQAEALAGTVLFAPPLDEAGVIWAHEVIGCVVIDAEGIERGTVTALQDNPASDLLVLDTGALVPLVFVVDGPRDGQVHVAVPPGLFDL